MGLFCIDLLRKEAQAFPNPEDMGVDRKGFPPQTKKKKTVNGFWPNPFEAPNGSFNSLRIHLF